MKILCIDLDGVILEYKSGQFNSGEYGQVTKGASTYLKKLMNLGYHVIIYTCRNDNVGVEAHLKKYKIYKGVHYTSINERHKEDPTMFCGKFGADIYLDDRAITFNGKWSKAYNNIKRFLPWGDKKAE